nr:solute carrier family 10 member 6-like [Biomphalaria glabrata]
MLSSIELSDSQTDGDTNPDTTKVPPTQGMSDQLVTVNVISNIGRPGALLFSLDVTAVFLMNYTLRCLSLDTVYALTAMTMSPNVARIDNSKFNISCASAVPWLSPNSTANSTMPLLGDVTLEDDNQGKPPRYVGYVQGRINVTLVTNNIGRSFLLVLADRIAGVDPSNQTQPSSGAQSNHQGFITRSDINVSSDNNGASIGAPVSPGLPQLPPNTVGRAMIIVMQLPRPIDTIFRILLYIFIILATTGMGVKVEISVIKAVLKKPVAPIIGLLCQYVGMPLIAFLIAKTVPQDSAAISLGIFTCGIVPGGGPSNMFTYLLGGDLSLSIAMTTISSVAALGLIPFWIFTLGSLFKDDTVNLKIPYENILETLAIAILPIFLGIFIKYKLPKVAKVVTNILKPALMIVVLFITSLGIYTNLFIFKMIKPMTIAAGCLLPYIGYIVGGLIAFLCCQSWTRVKTIAIETGIQNMGIAFLIVYLSLPPPDNQLAVVGPASSAIMTPLPLLVLVVFYFLYQRRQNTKGDKSAEIDVVNNNEEKTTLTTSQEDNEMSSSTQDKKTSRFKLFKKTNKEDEKRKEAKKNEAKRLALKKLAEGEGTAAIIVLWQKLTKGKVVEDPGKSKQTTQSVEANRTVSRSKPPSQSKQTAQSVEANRPVSRSKPPSQSKQTAQSVEANRPVSRSKPPSQSKQTAQSVKANRPVSRSKPPSQSKQTAQSVEANRPVSRSKPPSQSKQTAQSVEANHPFSQIKTVSFIRLVVRVVNLVVSVVNLVVSFVNLVVSVVNLVVSFVNLVVSFVNLVVSFVNLLVSFVNLLVSFVNLLVSFVNLLVSFVNLLVSFVNLLVSFVNLVVSFVNLVVSFVNLVVSFANLVVSFANLVVSFVNFVVSYF